MSLTSQIEDSKSPVGAFFRTRFPNTRAVVTECNKSLRNAETIHPTERIGKDFGTLGTAIDYRLRYYFAATPSQDLVAWRGAQMVNDRGFHGRVELAAGGSFVELPKLPEEIVEGFFQNLDVTLADLQPVGRKLDRDAESCLIAIASVWRCLSSAAVLLHDPHGHCSATMFRHGLTYCKSPPLIGLMTSVQCPSCSTTKWGADLRRMPF